MNRGRNFLMETACRDLGRSVFYKELIFVAACLAFVAVLQLLGK